MHVLGSAYGTFFWLFVLAATFGPTALVGYYYYQKSSRARKQVGRFLSVMLVVLGSRTIRLPGAYGRSSGQNRTGWPGYTRIHSVVPYWVVSQMDSMDVMWSRQGYPDAQIPQFEDVMDRTGVLESICNGTIYLFPVFIDAC